MSSSIPEIPEPSSSYLVILIIALNIFSILASIYALFTYTIFRIYFKGVVDRVSVRLSVAQSVLDLTYSAVQLWSDFASANEPNCSLSVLFYIFFTLYSLFLFAAIAFNLHYIFLCKKFNRKSLELAYHVAGLVAAAVISTSGFLLNAFGWDEPQETCWFKNDGTNQGFIEQILILHIWTIITTLYSSLVVLGVIYKIRQEKKLLNLVGKSNNDLPSATSNKPDLIISNDFPSESNHGPFERRKKRQKEVMRMVRRIALYPLIPFLTQWPNFFVGLLAFLNNGGVAEGLVVWSFVGNCSQGMVNMLALMLDPAIITCRKLLLEDMEENRIEFPFTFLSRLISYTLLFSPVPKVKTQDYPMQAMPSPKISDISNYNVSLGESDRVGGLERAEQYDLLSFTTATNIGVMGPLNSSAVELSPQIEDFTSETYYAKNHQFFSKF